jgi:hypothetical protein
VSAPELSLRPRDFAVLLLSSADAGPRQRARDQQADRAGLEIERRVLRALVERDPEPDELEGTLVAIIEDLGPPPGPTRAVALGLLEEWRAVRASPGLLDHLLERALEEPRTKGGRRGGQLPG